MNNILLTRRKFVIGTGAFSLASLMPFKLAFATAPTDKRFMLVILRGALDGLSAVVPYKDPQYTELRGSVAMPQNAENLIDLDGYFAMNKALGGLSDMYKNKELLILHATATPYRDRSHFDAQDLLENGTDKPHMLGTGWLNRAVESLNDGTQAIAIGPAIPLVLTGNAQVSSWAPSVLPSVDEDFLSRIEKMYSQDPLLSKALAEGRMNGNDVNMKEGRGPRAFIPMMGKAAEFLSKPNGPRIASIDITGWDTHANQLGRLTNVMGILSDGIRNFKDKMGDEWKNSTVLVITEFGRTVRANGSNGTDHGTGSVAFLAGGNVNGGKILGDWPTLSKLYQDRDLYPANDTRSLIKSALNQHLGISEEILSQKIFPGSSGVPAYNNIFRS